YPRSEFPEPLSWLVDEERRAAFEESGSHFESGYHLTLQYLPPRESRARAARLIYENTPTNGVDWRERLAAFVTETDRLYDLLDGRGPRADARRRAPARGDGSRLPGLQLAGHARRPQPARLCLPLDDALPVHGQGRGGEGTRSPAPAVVRQAQERPCPAARDD